VITVTTVLRLYPEPDRTLYVRVRVHPTLKAMHERSRELTAAGTHEHRAPMRHVRGFCTEWNVVKCTKKRARRHPCIAEVNFAGRYCTMEIVTHELLHATMAWARRVGFEFSRLGDDDHVNAEEERIAYVHGEMCRQFMVRANTAGVYA